MMKRMFVLAGFVLGSYSPVAAQGCNVLCTSFTNWSPVPVTFTVENAVVCGEGPYPQTFGVRPKTWITTCRLPNKAFGKVTVTGINLKNESFTKTTNFKQSSAHYQSIFFYGDPSSNSYYSPAYLRSDGKKQCVAYWQKPPGKAVNTDRDNIGWSKDIQPIQFIDGAEGDGGNRKSCLFR